MKNLIVGICIVFLIFTCMTNGFLGFLYKIALQKEIDQIVHIFKSDFYIYINMCSLPCLIYIGMHMLTVNRHSDKMYKLDHAIQENIDKKRESESLINWYNELIINQFKTEQNKKTQ